MNIVNIPIESLIPYDNNARTHSDEQIAEIAASIKEFGFNNPILLDEKNMIIAGHGRLMAAKASGMKDVPTITLSHLTPTKKKAYILADNRIALNAGWSSDKLQQEFEALLTDNFDIKLTGFTSDEINAFLNPEKLNDGLCDADDVPQIETERISKLGDIWILGNHRLMCGDSTMIDQVDKLINNNSPILMVTDPPYGVKYNPEWRDDCDLGVGERSRGKVENDDRIDWKDAYSLFNGDVAYVWHAAIHGHKVAQNIIDCGFDIVSQIIWVKQHFALSRGDYHWQHEPCWYAVRKGKKHNWNGARNLSTTWEIKNNNSFGNANPEETWGHGTQKPIDCMLKPIENNTKQNDYVYDPFGGSGTTLIACEKTSRNCLMMELDQNYCDVIIRRWQKFTGNKAILESNNKTFEEIEND